MLITVLNWNYAFDFFTVDVAVSHGPSPFTINLTVYLAEDARMLQHPYKSMDTSSSATCTIRGQMTG